MTFSRSAGTVVAAVAIGVLPGCAEAPLNAPASDAAIERIARPEAHLRSFLFRYAYGNTAVLSDVHRLGRELGCIAVSEAVEQAVARHVARWRRDLVASYREQVPAKQLAEASALEPEAAERKLKPFRDQIWQAMGGRNGEPEATANQQVEEAVAAKATSSSRQPPTERELRELKYETIGFELCPELQAVIRMEDR